MVRWAFLGWCDPLSKIMLPTFSSLYCCTQIPSIGGRRLLPICVATAGPAPVTAEDALLPLPTFHTLLVIVSILLLAASGDVTGIKSSLLPCLFFHATGSSNSTELNGTGGESITGRVCIAYTVLFLCSVNTWLCVGSFVTRSLYSV